MVKHTKGFKGLSKKVLSAILAASMIMTSSSFVLAAEPTNGPVVENVEAGEVATPDASNAVAGQVLGEHSDGDVTVDEVSGTYTYNSEEQKPEPVVKLTDGGTPLTKDTDYTLSYSHNVNAGEAEVTVNFKGEYANLTSITKKFTIDQVDLSKAKVKYNTIETAFVYNGKDQYPEIESVTVDVTVTGGTKTLSVDDYEVVANTSANLVDVGTKAFKIKAKDDSNFKGESQEYNYTIEAAPLSSKVVSASMGSIEYKNTASDVKDEIEKRIVIKDLLAGKDIDVSDFTIEYQNDGRWGADPSVDVGTHVLRLKAKQGNFKSEDDSQTVETTYEITLQGSLQNEVNMNMDFDDTAEIVWDDAEYCFTGAYTGVDKFIDSDDIAITGLEKDVDYKITTSEAEWINAGEYAVELVGLNKYEGQTVTIPVKIAPKYMVEANGQAVTGIDVEAVQGKHPSGNLGSVVVTVKDGSDLLTEGVDYTYEVKTSGDSKKVEVTGIGNYTTVRETVKVLEKNVTPSEKLPLSDSSISAEVNREFDYTGSKVDIKESDITVVENDNGKKITLSPDRDYYIKDTADDTSAGIATVTIEGKGKYEGERELTFKINGVSFADVFEVKAIDDVAKDTTAGTVTNAVKVTYKSTGATYAKTNYKATVLSGDQEVADTEQLKPGTYTLKVVPDGANKGQFEGSIEITFNVIGDDLKKAGAEIADIEDVVYTGEEQKPAVVVTLDKETLKEGEDYTVAYSDNVNGGEATVTVTGINDYSGTITKNFNITKAEQGIYMTVAAQERDLGNGSRYINSKDCTLKLATNVADPNTKYTFSSSDTSVATVSADGVIRYRQVGECVVTVSAAETENCKAATLDIKVKVGKVGAPTFTPSVTSTTAKKSFRVTTSTVRGADGFEVQYSIKSNFWAPKTKDFKIANKVTRQTCTTAQSNKTYYIRTRAYQVIDGEKVYSAWSPVKTVKTK